mmetsp:Transcript_4003/g.9642  ORF Transcript_4003/g.9642 Transcript_4003/m.9642 type:complete len:230 (-) Transcript_4003:323-1012(-)
MLAFAEVVPTTVSPSKAGAAKSKRPLASLARAGAALYRRCAAGTRVVPFGASPGAEPELEKEVDCGVSESWAQRTFAAPRPLAKYEDQHPSLEASSEISYHSLFSPIGDPVLAPEHDPLTLAALAGPGRPVRRVPLACGRAPGGSARPSVSPPAAEDGAESTKTSRATESTNSMILPSTCSDIEEDSSEQDWEESVVEQAWGPREYELSEDSASSCSSVCMESVAGGDD